MMRPPSVTIRYRFPPSPPVSHRRRGMVGPHASRLEGTDCREDMPTPLSLLARCLLFEKRRFTVQYSRRCRGAPGAPLPEQEGGHRTPEGQSLRSSAGPSPGFLLRGGLLLFTPPRRQPAQWVLVQVRAVNDVNEGAHHRRHRVALDQVHDDGQQLPTIQLGEVTHRRLES
jgi:hypothetical protein